MLAQKVCFSIFALYNNLDYHFQIPENSYFEDLKHSLRIPSS